MKKTKTKWELYEQCERLLHENERIRWDKCRETDYLPDYYAICDFHSARKKRIEKAYDKLVELAPLERV